MNISQSRFTFESQFLYRKTLQNAYKNILIVIAQEKKMQLIEHT